MPTVEPDFEKFARMASALLCISNHEGRIRWLSAGWEPLLGFSNEELMAAPFLDHVVEEDRGATKKAMAALVQGESVVGFVNRYRTRAGGIVWLRWNASPADDGFVYNEALDMTEERELRAELERRLKLLELAGAQRDVGYWELDLGRRALSWSNQTKRIHGLSPQDQTPGLDGAIEFYHPGDRKLVGDLVQRAIDTGAPFDFDARIVRVDGEERSVHSTGIVDHSGDQPIVFGVFEDMTERLQTEASLREAQRREQLAALAGGIAHDFNNLLGGIMGNASLANMADTSARETAELLQGILELSEHGAKLTRQLLAFAGRGRQRYEEVDVAELLRDMSELLRVVVPRHVALRFDIRPSTAVLRADAVQLRQLVVNLVGNAAEAIGDERGTIWVILDIRTRTLDGASAIVDGRSLILEVADDGVGMSEEVQQQLFDPFFTTKPKGHGLGLAAVQGIVEGHEGRVEVESQVEEGATFRVILPLTGTTSTDTESPSLEGREGLVLVVDDETMLRRVLRRGLERAGFEVIEAADGREGLARFLRQEGDVDLVLLDLMMPEMGGLEVLQEIRGRGHDTRVLLMSGYHQEDLDSDLNESTVFLHKPFRIPKLVAAVRELLGKS